MVRPTASDVEGPDPDEIANNITIQQRAHRQTIIGITLIGLAAIAGAFLLGRSTAADRAPTSACEQARSALTRLGSEQQQAGTSDAAARTRALTAMNLILQNRSCFDPEVVALAQTAKEQNQSNADQQAISDAADRIARCASGDRLGC